MAKKTSAETTSATAPPLLCASSQPARSAVARPSAPARARAGHVRRAARPIAGQNPTRKKAASAFGYVTAGDVEVGRMRDEAEPELGRDRERAEHAHEERDRSPPLDGVAEGDERRPERECVEGGQERLVARERRKRRPGDGDRDPGCEREQRCDPGCLDPARCESGSGKGYDGHDEPEPDGIREPVCGVDAAEVAPCDERGRGEEGGDRDRADERARRRACAKSRKWPLQTDRV